MDAAARDFETLTKEGFDPAASGNIFGQIISEYGGMVGNRFVPEDMQQYIQIQNTWGGANLRDKSGAVLGADELRKELKNYWPQPGDSPRLVVQKLKSRQVAEDAMQSKSGGVRRKPTSGGNSPRQEEISKQFTQAEIRAEIKRRGL